jgi:hypothetical protein
MKKISTILFLSIFSVSAFAGIEIKTKETTDTVPYVVDNDELDDFNDSLITLPSTDLYCDWDTVNTHYPKFNIDELKDCNKEIALYNKNSCGYVHPFLGKVTSEFGPRKRRYHYGTDIDLETGDAVGSAFDGRVRIAKKSKTYGNVVVIRHSNGLETYYAHLSKINVEIGQEVYAGQIIGLGGNTGHSHGSHLHFEIRYLGQPINPTEIISFTDHKLICDTLTLSKKTFDYVFEAKKAAVKNYASGKGKYGKGKVYVIRKGDTLSSIARKHGTTTAALCKKNGLRTTANLRKGQKLKF